MNGGAMMEDRRKNTRRKDDRHAPSAERDTLQAENERLKLEHDYEIIALDDARKAAEARLVECEGVSLLRKKSEETWERQYYRAEARCAELEVKFQEYEKFCMSIARAYGEGPISNTSESQEGEE